MPSLSFLSIWYAAHSPSLNVFFYPLSFTACEGKSIPLQMSHCPIFLVQSKTRQVYQYIQQYGTFHVALLTIGSERIQESNSAVFVIAVKRIRRTQSSRSRKHPIFQVHLVSNDSLRPKKVFSVRHDAEKGSRSESSHRERNFLSIKEGRDIITFCLMRLQTKFSHHCLERQI